MEWQDAARRLEVMAPERWALRCKNCGRPKAPPDLREDEAQAMTDYAQARGETLVLCSCAPSGINLDSRCPCGRLATSIDVTEGGNFHINCPQHGRFDLPTVVAASLMRAAPERREGRLVAWLSRQ